MEKKDATRFWAKVDRSGDCRIWTAARKQPEGYGFFKLNRRMAYAHRVSWSLANGQEIPPGMFVCHRCDNPPCVRPEHLFLGSNSDNLQDASRKGRTANGERNGKYTQPKRTPRGEAHGRAKLTADQVRHLRLLFAEGMTQNALAERYGIAQGVVSQIVNRRIWRHL